MHLVVTGVTVLALSAILCAQNAPAAPAFEVASVKRNTGQPGPPLMDGRAFRQSGRVTVTNMTVLALLQVLYRGERPVAIQGGPSWISTDRFDIVAVGDPKGDADIPDGRPLPRLEAMMKTLLADRFRLRSRVEYRAQQGYALVPSNPRQPTAKLTVSKATCQTNACGSREITAQGINGTAMSMDELAGALSRVAGVGSAIENRTGIDGRFDIALVVETDPGVSTPEHGARVMTALKEQLGLSLQQIDTRTEVLVIDDIQQPTEN